MSQYKLGQLERVAIRDVWASESSDFTPWLASEDNIGMLGDTIGMDLEVEAVEKFVGPFRADILCKNTLNGDYVLIENQYDKTDHSHLGQTLTYAAGLSAKTVIWIAERFTEEHRAALDWLNELTTSELNFFGLELELWRIGNSNPAPKFNIVCQPNDWRKNVAGAANKLAAGELSATQQIQLEYWTAFRNRLMEQKQVNPVKPQPQCWTSYTVGKSDFWINVFTHSQKKHIGVALIIAGPQAKVHFQGLKEAKEQIEAEIKLSLDWREMPEKSESRILAIHSKQDPMDKLKWDQQHTWLMQTLMSFHKAFRGRVKQLDPSTYESE